MKRKALLILLALTILLTAPAAALTLDCPETLPLAEPLRLSGSSSAPSVTIAISGGVLCPDGAALEDLAVYNLRAGSTTVPVINGRWEYTWNIDGRLDPFVYRITAADTTQSSLTASFLYADA